MVSKTEDPVRRKFDAKSIEKILKFENKFATNLFSILPIPTSAIHNDEQSEENEDTSKLKVLNVPNRKSRAKSLEELQNRLKSIQGKKKLSYKDKLLRKGLKTRVKKKTKRDERNAEKKIIRAQQTNASTVKQEPDAETVETKPKTAKPIFNCEGKMVFSKFDFTGIGVKHEKKTEKDPKKMLKILEKQTAKIDELREQGEDEKVKIIKEKFLWKNVLAKATGEKVKDDPLLLKKSIKKREQLKKKSQKKWQVREEGVQKRKDDRQKKRTENIDKKKKQKKLGKLKQAAKRGKIIPGLK